MESDRERGVDGLGFRGSGNVSIPSASVEKKRVAFVGGGDTTAAMVMVGSEGVEEECARFGGRMSGFAFVEAERVSTECSGRELRTLCELWPQKNFCSLLIRTSSW